MLIPYSTDAPLYHWPVTTGAMIGVNLMVFGWSFSNPEAAYEYTLWYGQGLHPIQWITSNFLHGGFVHLFGNMIGLWVYGLIVEGKLGWWKTLAVMMGIGIIQCAVEQTLTLGMEESYSLGFSSVIYGIMAMCLVWAPMNHVHCLFIFFYRFITFEIAVLYLVGIYLLLQIGALVLLAEFSWGSEVLHLMGAAIGAGLAITLLKTKAVDCEGWDVFSVFLEKQGVLLGQSKEDAEAQQKAKEEKKQALEAQQQQLDRRQEALQRVRQLMGQGQPRQALQFHQQMLAESHDWQLAEADLLQLIGALQHQRLWRESVPVMIEFLKKHPANSDPVRIKLAHVLIAAERRPAQALKVLAKLNPALMMPALQNQVAQLEAQATAMRPQLPHEVADQDW